MAKLPPPPPVSRLRSLGAEVRTIPAATTVWRVYFRSGGHPTTWRQLRAWGPTASRFDHHLPPPSLQTRGILYGAIGPQAAVTSLAEVFQATRIVERVPRDPAWVAFELIRDLRLLDLTGAWPTRAGASMAIATGRRDRAREWSRAVYDAFPDIDGLLYGSSMHASEPSVALYERAATAMPSNPVFHRALRDPAVLSMLRPACARIGYGLL